MRYLFFAVIVIECAIACNQPVRGKNGEVYKTSVQYNDYIINRQSILIKDVIDLTKVAQTNLDSADKMLDNFVEKTDGLITDIKGMPSYKGDSSFRDAAIASFSFYKKIFGNEYKQLVDIRKHGGDATQEGVDQMNEIVNNISKEEEKYDKAFHNAQKDFAERNHMKLGENKMQKELNKMK